MFDKIKKWFNPAPEIIPEPVATVKKAPKKKELTPKEKATSIGEPDAQIVDRWFQTVCRNIALEVYEQEQADPEKRESEMRVIQQRDLGGGFTEVS